MSSGVLRSIRNKYWFIEPNIPNDCFGDPVGRKMACIECVELEIAYLRIIGLCHLDLPR